jgi:hypothetical protein
VGAASHLGDRGVPHDVFSDLQNPPAALTAPSFHRRKGPGTDREAEFRRRPEENAKTAALRTLSTAEAGRRTVSRAGEPREPVGFKPFLRRTSAVVSAAHDI